MWPMRWWRECSFSITLNLESCLPTSAFAIGFSSQAWVIQLGSRSYTTQPTDPLLDKPMAPIQGEVFAMILLKNIYFAWSHCQIWIRFYWNQMVVGTRAFISRSWRNIWNGFKGWSCRAGEDMAEYMEWSPFVVQTSIVHGVVPIVVVQTSIVLACPAKHPNYQKKVWGFEDVPGGIVQIL